MKSLLFALSLVNFAAPAFAKDGVFVANTERSVLQWHGKKVIGGSHTGKVKVKSGQALIVDGKVKDANVIVDMTSLIDEDLKEAEWNQKLVGHLKSPDFFDVVAFPSSELKIATIEPQSGGDYLLTGTLTIKGKSQPVKVKATERLDGESRVIKADLVFDRTAFDIKYGSGKFFSGLGDKMIADEVKVEVELVLDPEGVKSAQL